MAPPPIKYVLDVEWIIRCRRCGILGHGGAPSDDLGRKADDSKVGGAVESLYNSPGAAAVLHPARRNYAKNYCAFIRIMMPLVPRDCTLYVKIRLWLIQWHE